MLAGLEVPIGSRYRWERPGHKTRNGRRKAVAEVRVLIAASISRPPGRIDGQVHQIRQSLDLLRAGRRAARQLPERAEIDWLATAGRRYESRNLKCVCSSSVLSWMYCAMSESSFDTAAVYAGLPLPPGTSGPGCRPARCTAARDRSRGSPPRQGTAGSPRLRWAAGSVPAPAGRWRRCWPRGLPLRPRQGTIDDCSGVPDSASPLTGSAKRMLCSLFDSVFVVDRQLVARRRQRRRCD